MTPPGCIGHRPGNWRLGLAKCQKQEKPCCVAANQLAPGHIQHEQLRKQHVTASWSIFPERERGREKVGPASPRQARPLYPSCPVTRCLFFYFSSHSFHLQTQTAQEKPMDSIKDQWSSCTENHPLEREDAR